MLKILTYLFAALQTFDLSAYERPSYVDESIWNAASPHFISEDDPLKSKLDSIFMSSRVSSTVSSLKRAGFSVKKNRHWDNVYVCRHKKLKGCVLKIYTDDQIGVNEWDPLVRRVTGAIAIQEAINKHRWQNMFKVPKKWIYPLPEFPDSNPTFQRKNFILIAEEMNTFKNSRNEQRWYGPSMNADKLQALFILLKEVGLMDSVFPTNVPFCTDGRLAFVDTEHHHKWPVPYYRLLPFLAEDMQHYWQALIDSDGE